MPLIVQIDLYAKDASVVVVDMKNPSAASTDIKAGKRGKIEQKNKQRYLFFIKKKTPINTLLLCI